MTDEALDQRVVILHTPTSKACGGYNGGLYFPSRSAAKRFLRTIINAKKHPADYDIIPADKFNLLYDAEQQLTKRREERNCRAVAKSDRYVQRVRRQRHLQWAYDKRTRTREYGTRVVDADGTTDS